MAEKFRAQIILERSQHDALVDIASKQRKSISEVVRDILMEYFSEQKDFERKQAFEALDALHGIRERQPIYTGDLVAESREEREHELDDQ
jgi:hypothetical protein